MEGNKETIGQFIQRLRESIESGSFIKLTLSKPGGRDKDLRNVYARLVELKGEEALSFTLRYATRDEVKNHPISEALAIVGLWLGEDFLNGDLFTLTGDVSIQFSKKRKARLFDRPASLREQPSKKHNRQKQYLIEPENNPYLYPMGVTSAQGKILAAGQAKYRQINKYIEIIDSLLFSYLDEQRLPAYAIFVLDVSGSMRGSGIRDLKAAINNLTGLDESLTGRFARFRSREIITLVAFSDHVEDIQVFQIDDVSSQGNTMAEVRTFVDDLRADGGTAIYSALREAYQLATEAQQQDPDRLYAIVLMSDGENTDGMSAGSFENFFEGLSEDAQNIRTFTVLFGDADEKTMQALADLTNGRMFDGTTESLSFIFKQIRGYQ